MSDTTAPEEPGVGPNAGRTPSLLVPLIVAAGLGVVGFLVWAAVSPGVWHDDGAYLLLGKSLADGEGLRYSQVPGSLPGAKFPPLYPLFLALLWKVSPEAVGQGQLASLFNLLFVASSGGMFVAYLRSLDFSWRSSVVSAVLFWLLPGLWRLALVPLSEPLFLVTLVAALWTGSRLEAPAHMASTRGIPGRVRTRLPHPNHGARRRDRDTDGLADAGPDGVGAPECCWRRDDHRAVDVLVGPGGSCDSSSPS